VSDLRPVPEPGGPGPRRPGRQLARRQTVAHMVATYLRSAIIAGRLRAGEFVRIDTLAKELEVSITPVREALVALQSDGLVEALPHRGFRVTQLRRSDIEDAYLVQRFVAGELAARAATRLTEADIVELEQIQRRITQAYERRDDETVEGWNDEFHRLINTSAGAPKLGVFLGIALRYVPRALDSAITGWPDATATDHSDIINALRARDPERSREAMVRHIEHASRLLVEHLEKVGLWEAGEEQAG
jgi:DNA-binding GntR family transcriptional regulator